MNEAFPLIAPRELDFLLHDWLEPDRSADERETTGAVIDMATKLAASEFLTHYKLSDANEPRLVDGRVELIPEIGAALRQYADAGLSSASFEERWGGGGLSHLVASAVFSQFGAANIATAGYPMLARANARLITSFGTDAQIDQFARPQIDGRWYGTMCLSEPQAGSDLALVQTRAAPDGEDEFGARYRLTGNKMWISGGDHELTENIVHLVLAKIPDDDGRLPDGTAGISLFIVPKVLPDGTRNDLAVAGLNHKMGYRGTVNCLLNFGETDGAVGWRVGEPQHGLRQMFQMMNEARLDVGLGAAALACRSYAHAVNYARERRQGRPTGTRAGPAHALIGHVDVRRMLLALKSYAEGALALCLYCAKLVDDRADPAADALLGLLTPIAKTWSAEYGLAANDIAIQIHGGYGYTRDFDVEQLYRDNRLNPIHEGATAIQAIDLVGRKLAGGNASGLAVLRTRIEATIAAAGPELAAPARALGEAWETVERTVAGLADAGGERFDNATLFLRGLGHVVVAWLWLDQAGAALGARSSLDPDFVDGKVVTCRYFAEAELPHAAVWLRQVEARSDIAAHAEARLF